MFVYKDSDQIRREVKKAIIDAGMTQTEVAAALDMLPQNLHRITSRKNIIVGDLARIADVIGCEIVIDIRPKSDPGTM